jgi:hypothetical protein
LPGFQIVASITKYHGHHEAREGHEGFGNYYISIFFLRDLRDLRGEIFVSILVAALPRWDLCGENARLCQVLHL